MKLVTEYLVIIEKIASEAFYALCDNIGEFNKLLQTDPDIHVEGPFINYKHATKFAYTVKTNKIEGKDSFISKSPLRAKKITLKNTPVCFDL